MQHVVDDCASCVEALAAPLTSGAFRASCPSCAARAFARSPAAKDALIGYPDALKGAMQAIWPSREQYTKGRTLVYEWMKKIDAAKEKK